MQLYLNFCKFNRRYFEKKLFDRLLIALHYRIMTENRQSINLNDFDKLNKDFSL